MSLIERLPQEIKAAMLARDADRLSTLRLLKSAIGYAQIERKNENLSDLELIAIVQKEIKKRRDAIEQYEKAGRLDSVAKEKIEMTVLESFLPPPLSSTELEQMVRDAILAAGATDKKSMGQVIKAVQAQAAGRADGKTISTLVGSLLP